jgi:hypothetical protein
MNRFHHRLLGMALVMLGASCAGSALAQEAQPDTTLRWGTSYQNDTSLPLYYLPAWHEGDEDRKAEEEREAAKNPQLPNHHVDSVDPVVQNTMAPVQQMPAPIINFDGITFPGVGCNCAPPDTNGEVGETQYVQMVNEGLQVFDKATGNSVMGPVAISSLWSGFGGVCETSGSGDPVVLYDQLANRWLISQFAGSGIPTDECIAISTSSDAAGSYHRYGFHLGSNFFDYPHLGVWPDGYYMAMNIFNSSGTAFLGPQAFVFDRTAMLAGNPAATFITPGITGGGTESSFLPADLDGSAPPPIGAPNPFVSFPGNGTYKVRHFHADFATPANSTFNLNSSPAAAGFSTLCSGNRSCVPQLGVADKLDAIGDRLMFRLAYRNFGSHESLVGNFTVRSNNVAGVRWFELRNVTSGPATVFQESTFQPDTTWRWMGSIAMDTQGNLAVGYSASDASTNPQLRYAGRLAGDPLNNLAQGEAHLFDGTGSQTGTGSRWGDYSALTVDPVDDCTFWFTSEYYGTTASFNWRTRIGNFKFPGCSLEPGFTLAPTPAETSVCAGTPASVTINAGSTGGFNGAVTLSASGNPAPSTVSFSPNPIPTLPGSSTMQVGNTGGVAAGVYPINVHGTASGASNEDATVTLSVFTTAPGAPSLAAPSNNATNQPVRPTFSWSGSNSEQYTIEVATDAAFTSVVYTETVTGTTATPGTDLASNTQYYWRVTAANACGAGAASPTFTFSTLPLPGDCSAGSTAQTLYNYGFESGLNGWTLGAGSIANSWADNATAHSGTHSWKANDPGLLSDQRLVSPSIALPTGEAPLTLQYWNRRGMEANGATGCYDGGILEASTNGGSTWTQVGSASLLTDPYTGPISTSFSNPLGGLQAWCGTTEWVQSIVDVSAMAGQNVQFRFRLGSDTSVGADGWYLDDVKVQSCAGGEPVQYTITPVAGANGSIAPSTPQVVDQGETVAFTLTPDTGFQIASVTGCGGSLAGSVYTTAPASADCTVTAAFGPVPTYTVGGNVGGLAGDGLVLRLNGGNDLPVSASGSFEFPLGLEDGDAYAVTVATQPSDPSQTCTVANGSGTINGADVTNVSVTCTTSTYTVGGTVSGLLGSGLVLQVNGGGNLPIAADGSFTFAAPLADGSAYAVTVASQPTGPVQVCTVSNGSGTVAGANVTNVQVSCSDRIYVDGFDG